VAPIGILGGTFNPLHIGHLVCAEEACAQLGLDRVLLVPVAAPPHKEARDDPGAQARVEMCRLAVAGNGRLEVSTIEVDRGGLSYTVDTLREIHARAPEDDLTFIVGGDMAASLPTWREPQAILELARLGVAERSGVRRDDILERVSGLGVADRVVFFEMPRLDISSSDVRARVAAGRPIRYLVPDAVARFIAERALYRAPAGKALA
jgi:nicotinate-nucleotide adenylyltransferase